MANYSADVGSPSESGGAISPGYKSQNIFCWAVLPTNDFQVGDSSAFLLVLFLFL